MATYCIICAKEKSGVPIADDRVLQVMRWFKRNITKDAKGNRLVVCKDDLEGARKRRDKFNSRKNLYMAVGIIFIILGLVISFTPRTVILSAIVLLTLYLLSLLNYAPGLVLEQNKDVKIKHKQ